MKKIYFITKYTYETEMLDIISYYFKSETDARKYILNKLSIEGLNKTLKQFQRGLITPYEYVDKNCYYEIKTLLEK